MATKLYDAIVSADGKSDYLLPSAAFAAGAKSVFLRSGVYGETANVVIPNGGTLDGESLNNAIIDFTGTSFSVQCDSAPTSIQSAGTIAVTGASTAVIGTGTTFTSLSPGDSISIGGVYLP